MPTLYSLTFPQALANARLDLSDTDSSDYRWTDSDLTRAIDRSIEAYSRANPLIRGYQIPAIPRQSIYPLPADAFYATSVEYPAGCWPRALRQFLNRRSTMLAPPTTSDMAGITASPATGGAIPSGFYEYALTYTGPGGGETTVGPATSQITVPSSGSVTLTGIPTGPYGATGRTLYRSPDGATWGLVTTIPDITTTTYTDTTATTGAAPPATNTTGDIDIVELLLPPELWPQDGTRLLEIAYAAKHTLDDWGTTIPERHWDTLVLGTVAYAMFAYLPQVNDNFQYADGHLRDRVDDTASTIAWQTQCRMAMTDLEKQLKVIREEANAAISTAQMPHWGDVPYRWERL